MNVFDWLDSTITLGQLIGIWFGWRLFDIVAAFGKEWATEFKKVRRNRRGNEAFVRAEAERREKEKDLAVRNATKSKYPL